MDHPKKVGWRKPVIFMMMGQSFAQSYQRNPMSSVISMRSLALFLAAIATLATADRAFAAKQPPNILFILTDQQHANMLSSAGNPYLKTRALDGMAKSGIRFTNACV